LFIEQAGTGNILTLHDQASDTSFVAIDQNGKVNTIASDATVGAGFNIPHGTAPTTPVNGDIWTTTSGLLARINGATRQYVDLDGTQTINGTKTFSAANQTLGNATSAGTIAIGSGATVSGSTRTIAIGTASAAGSTNTINIGGGSGTSTTTLNGTVNFTGPITGAINNITLGNGTAASTYNLFTGATVSGSTKTVQIATGAAAGSTTSITIGSTTGTSTTTLQGITNGVTQTAGDSSLKLATTAFVTTADNLKANLASPTFTGVPAAPTASAGTNTTQIATTAFVTAAVSAGSGAVWGSITGTLSSQTDLQSALDAKLSTATAASTYAPLASPTFTGTVTIPAGASISGYATTASLSSYAPLASPALTGTPTAPTATTGTNTTQLATTAFVQQEVPAASTTAAGKVELATLAEIITGTDTARVIPVSQIPVTTASPYLRSLAFINYTSISGSGAVTASSGDQFNREAYLSSTAAGRAQFGLGIPGQANANPAFHTANFGQINFSNKIVLSGTTVFGISGYAGNANTCIYVTLGGYSTLTTGAMTQKGFGIKKVGGTSNVIELIVHNGTSQTAVSSSTAPALAEAVNWTIYSDGTGNVTLYINGTQAATTSAGPTGTNTAGNSAYREQVECPSGSGATHSIHSVGGWVYIRP